MLGGALFCVQLVLQFLGADADDATELVAKGTPSDVAFKVLSVQGASAFFLMSGLTGLVCLRAFAWSAGPSLLAALFVGAATLWLLRGIYRVFSRLQSDGTLRVERALGATGSVYLTVAPEKPGTVTVVVEKRHLTREAITEGDEALPTGTPIIVHAIHETGALVVTRYDP